MILSHAHNFVFIKNRKVAGSSIEMFLSRFVGSADIVTVIGEEPKIIPENFRALFGRRIRYQNFSGFKNHMSSLRVIDRVGRDVWEDYFSFCFERSPISKVESYFSFITSDLKNADDAQSDFIDASYPEYCSDVSRYTDSGQIIVDQVANYDRLNIEFAEICNRIGIPFDGDLGFRLKDQHKKTHITKPSLTDEMYKEIANAYALERELLPFMQVEAAQPSSSAALPWCLARAALQNGQLLKAEQYILQARKSDEDFLPARREEARIMWRLGDKEASTQKMLNLHSLAPHRMQFAIEAAVFLRRTDKRPEANKLLQDALEISPRNGRVMAELAKFQAEDGLFEEAIATMKKSLSLVRVGTPAWINSHIRILGWSDQLSEAEQFILKNESNEANTQTMAVERGIVSFHWSIDLRISLANMALTQGDIKRAARLLLDRDVVEHTEGKALVPLARRLVGSGPEDFVSATFAEILQLGSTNSRLIRILLRVAKQLENAVFAAQIVSSLEEVETPSADLLKKAKSLHLKLISK